MVGSTQREKEPTMALSGPQKVWAIVLAGLIVASITGAAGMFWSLKGSIAEGRTSNAEEFGRLGREVSELRGDVRVQTEKAQHIQGVLEKVLAKQYTPERAAAEIRRIDEQVAEIRKRVACLEARVDKLQEHEK